ncbi:AbiH family protein [Chitinophaga sp. LS1]
MNRLIIVGNGFDLAHKMPTGYNDFILSYSRPMPQVKIYN